ncbi:MAG: hypothetical protein JXB26_12505 [Candidatus Aminicenantes bacterium]|nr:hypothetical protein [Candidatus Aminicenantes bacterium]
MKGKLRLFLFFILVLNLAAPFKAQETANETPEVFLSKLQEFLTAGDVALYLESFSPELRMKEKSRMDSILELTQAQAVFLFAAGKTEPREETGLYVQALYENPDSVYFEMWNLKVRKTVKGWTIGDKQVSGGLTRFFKIRIPSGREERVDSITIEGEDIRLRFEDAALFYDNLPENETALIVMGKGDVLFSPSDDIEKHMLEVLYKNSFLKDRLEYAFLRFTDSFFKDKIKIKKYGQKKRTEVSKEERERAERIFERHYPQSFTTRHPRTGGLLSFLPKNEEAVFEFKGKDMGLLSYIHTPSLEEAITLYSWKDERIINLYTPKRLAREKQLFLSFERNFDLLDCRILIHVDPVQAFLSGEARLKLKPESASLDVFKLKLNSALKILRIIDTEKRSLFFTQDKVRNVLYIYPFAPVAENEEYGFEVFYRGKFAPPVKLPDVVALSQLRGDSLKFQAQEYHSLLYSGSTYWYPSSFGDDYFTARLNIVVPSDYCCIANGEPLESKNLDEGAVTVDKNGNAGKTVYAFQTRHPVKYLSLIIGDFKEMERRDQPVPLKLFDSTNLIFSERDILKDAGEIISHYQEWFGPFPYHGLSVVRRPWPVGGGHSPASFVVINEVVHLTGRERFQYASHPVDLSRWKEYFIAHEIAHQWWGHGVSWKSHRDQWLSEGAAQFAAYLFLSEIHGEGVRSDILKKFSKWTNRYSDWGPVILGSRLSFYNFEAYQSIVYNKAALILNMLKDLTGDEIFFKGLRTYLQTYRYKAARTTDFIRTFHEVSGKDLSLFFSKWLWSFTLPETRIEHSVFQDEGFKLHITVRQLKDIFVFPLWVEWNDAGGKKREMLAVDRKRKNFVIETDGKPEKIKFNPDDTVPGKFYEK